jgi:hypothetical protein
MGRWISTWIWFACLLAAACNANPEGPTDGGDDALICADRLDCPALLGCVDGICGHCLRDRDCSVTEFCQPIEHLCYPIFVGECLLNQDCELGWFCVQGTCMSGAQVIPCTRDEQCAQGQRCDRLNLVCVLDLGCNRDEDCAAGEVCNQASKRCESACTPETADVICGFGLVCDEFGRCVECFEDSQCGVGLLCNLQTNRCEGENACLTDRDCLPGTICNPQTRQCTIRPPDCLSTADCPNGTLCDPPSGRCVPEQCRPDSLEPNDGSQDAAKLGPGRTSELNLCPQDVDWFRIDLARGDRLQVIVNTDFLAADHFQIVLFDPSSSEVLQEDNLLIDHVVAADGSYLLRAQTSDQQAVFSLIITVSRGIPCDDDALEPNDSAVAARPVGAGLYPGLAICPRDEDWYVIERPLNQILQVRIEFPALQGDLDLDLLAGDGQTLVMRSATAGDAELVAVDDNPGTRFFVRVWADSQVGNQYELRVTLIPK